MQLKNTGNHPKKIIKSVSLIVVFFLLVAIAYASYQAINLEFFTGDTETGVQELTKQDKIEDFKYLTSYVRDVYPYNDAITKHKSLDDINSLEEDYINRAGLTSSNSEFFKLVYEYTQRLRQGDDHIGVYFSSQPQNNNFLQYYLNNIKKSSYTKINYWGEEASKFKWYAFSDAVVVYDNGKYILDKEYQFSDITLPKGSIIEKVNGMKIDDYVMSLQNKTRLLLDTRLNKSFIKNLFSIDSDPDSDYWTVDFRLENGATYTGRLRKLNTDPNINDSLSLYSYPNVVLREINEDIGYMRFFTFYGQYISDDNEAIQAFMKASNGKYKKLIIDIRGNKGGELNYWSENLVRPLIKEPKL